MKKEYVPGPKFYFFKAVALVSLIPAFLFIFSIIGPSQFRTSGIYTGLSILLLAGFLYTITALQMQWIVVSGEAIEIRKSFFGFPVPRTLEFSAISCVEVSPMSRDLVVFLKDGSSVKIFRGLAEKPEDERELNLSFQERSLLVIQRLEKLISDRINKGRAG